MIAQARERVGSTWMSGSRDDAPDTPVRQLSQRPAESAHDHPNRAGHTKLGRRSPEVVEIHEQPKAIDITGPKTHHHVLPVGTPRQFVEEQVHANQNQKIEGTKRGEGDRHSGDDSRQQSPRAPRRTERRQGPYEEYRPVKPKQRPWSVVRQGIEPREEQVHESENQADNKPEEQRVRARPA